MYARRRDSNHSAILQAFRQLGCSTIDLGGVGAGVGDALIGYAGISLMIEIKDGAKSPSRRKLTAAQEKLRLDWTGGARLVTNMDDVEKTVAVLRRWKQSIGSDGA